VCIGVVVQGVFVVLCVPCEYVLTPFYCWTAG